MAGRYRKRQNIVVLKEEEEMNVCEKPPSEINLDLKCTCLRHYSKSDKIPKNEKYDQTIINLKQVFIKV